MGYLYSYGELSFKPGKDHLLFFGGFQIATIEISGNWMV